MKFNRIYVINGIAEDKFYENNATDLDFFLNGDYHLMNNSRDSI
jgi:putative NIF3 family GTP cyclohydrolase 1 type 2